MKSDRLQSRIFFVSSILALALTTLALPAAAQSYPTRPVRVIIPAAAGAGADAVGRPIALKLTEYLGQAVVLDFIAGASGSIGGETAAKAKPDGYTLIQGSNSSMSASPAFNPNLRYNAEKDFTPIAQTIDQPFFIVIHHSLPVRSMKELIAYAKANPGKVKFGGSTPGGGTHLAGELFNKFAGIEMQHVPYKSSAPMFADLLAGRIDLTFSAFNLVQEQVRAGKYLALATSGPKRQSNAQDVPTMAELGMPGYRSGSWYGWFAPTGTPQPIVMRLNAEINKAAATPEIRQRFGDGAVDPNTPEQFAAFVKADRARYQDLAKTLKVEIE